MSEMFAEFELAAMARPDVYKLLTSLVLPRPIAWVLSRDAAGGLNAAPFSFFNCASSDPPMIMLGITTPTDRKVKDTLGNLMANPRFVVNLVPEELAEAMSLTATNAPAGLDETELAGLELIPSDTFDVPRIAGSPAAFECRVWQTITPGPKSTIVLAEVLRIHIRESAFSDLSRLYIDPAKMRLVGRTSGPGGYCTTRDTFTIERKPWPLT